MITAATGGPVRALDVAGLERLDPTRFPGGEAAGLLSDGTRAYGTPLGIVVVPPSTAPADAVFGVQLFALPVAPRYATEAQQSDLVRRLATAWGIGAGTSRFGQSLAVRTFAEGRTHSLVALLVVPGFPDPCQACAFTVARFSADGTFVDAHVIAEHVVSLRPLRVMSAAAGFDSLRHYRDGVPDDPSSGRSVTTARLQLMSGDDPSMPAQIQWTFLDAGGVSVGTVYLPPSS
jgi:hypothetical protein